MNLMKIMHSTTSDEEESDASIDESQESNGSKLMSDHPQTADSQSSDEEHLEDSPAHFPTPPPDGDVINSQSKGENNVEIEKKKNMLMNVGHKGTVYAKSLDAIKSLNNRSGSSVVAIVKYLKSTGYEVAIEHRLPKLVLRALKLALVKEEVVQVKRSFKMSQAAKTTSKSVDKMRAQQEKQKKKLKKQDKARKQNAKVETESAAPEQAETNNNPKMKAAKLKTNSPVQKKPSAKKAAAADNAKVAAGVEAQEAVKKSKKPAIKAKPSKAVKTSSNMLASSKPISKAKGKRKSIGTLAPTTSQNSKVHVKSIKKLVAGKVNILSGDHFESELSPIESHSTPIASSTSVSVAKPKRKGR